jgi:hypothetical protein
MEKAMENHKKVLARLSSANQHNLQIVQSANQ